MFNAIYIITINCIHGRANRSVPIVPPLHMLLRSLGINAQASSALAQLLPLPSIIGTVMTLNFIISIVQRAEDKRKTSVNIRC